MLPTVVLTFDYIMVKLQCNGRQLSAVNRLIALKLQVGMSSSRCSITPMGINAHSSLNLIKHFHLIHALSTYFLRLYSLVVRLRMISDAFFIYQNAIRSIHGSVFQLQLLQCCLTKQESALSLILR